MFLTHRPTRDPQDPGHSGCPACRSDPERFNQAMCNNPAAFQSVPPFRRALEYRAAAEPIIKTPPLMKKPVLPTIAAYFLLLTATSALLTLYRMRVAGYAWNAPLIPHSSLSVRSQWLWVAGAAAANVGIAIALMRGWSWAKPLLFASLVVNEAVGLFTSETNLLAILLGLAFAAVPAIMVVLSRIEAPSRRTERIGRWAAARRAIGLCFYWAAAFVLFVVLTSLFSGNTPPGATGSDAGAGLFVVAALAIMLAGGTVIGTFAVAAREAALVLISLPSYLIVYCIWTDLSLKLVYPKHPWHFQWDDTGVWLAMLGMGGFGLMAVAEQREAA
ncbi:hypothetical protein [Ralstonia solanacearum]|nr:hypothetical protein [Ralstonia solanacearum]